MKKIILLLLAISLVFSFTACGSSDASTTEPEPTTVATTESTFSTTAALEKWKTKTESDMANFDYYNVVADEAGATISIATNGFAEVMENAKASGYDETYESWSNVRTSVVDMCNVFSDYAKAVGLTDYPISVAVLDDRNHDNILLNVASGAVSYDYMADAPDLTMGQKNALTSARSYLNYSAFSHDGLIGQLEYEGYTTEEATFAANNCGADWNEQALKKALSYLDYSAFSYTGLIGQLEFEKFTTEQATYAVDNCGADWNEQAVKKAKSYLEYSSFSKDKLIGQLEYEGFTHEQAVYGAEANGY